MITVPITHPKGLLFVGKARRSVVVQIDTDTDPTTSVQHPQVFNLAYLLADKVVRVPTLEEVKRIHPGSWAWDNFHEILDPVHRVIRRIQELTRLRTEAPTLWPEKFPTPPRDHLGRQQPGVLNICRVKLFHYLNRQRNERLDIGFVTFRIDPEVLAQSKATIKAAKEWRETEDGRRKEGLHVRRSEGFLDPDWRES